MGTRNIGTALTVLLIIPIALFIGVWVLTNPTGAISGLNKLVIIGFAFTALVNPRLGLLLLVPQVLYVDEIKRLAVSYGAVSYETIYEVLLGPILTLAMLNAGFFFGVSQGRFKLGKSWTLFYLLIVILCLVMFAAGSGSFASRGQSVLNTGLYMTLIPLMVGICANREEAFRIIKWQVVWSIPSLIWGIQQYFFGLNSMEVSYAKTGLSSTHFLQVVATSKPRPFGLFGSATGFGVIGLYAGLVVAAIIWERKNLVVNVLIAAVYAWAIFASRQRTILFMAPMVVCCAFMFYSKIRTVSFYFIVISLFFSGVYFSQKLMTGGLDVINSAIAQDGAWSREVLNVSTFSDRLRGWTRLQKASTYSWFGTEKKEAKDRVIGYGDEDFRHDIINTVLIKTGVVGLSASLLVLFVTLSKLHGRVFNLKDNYERRKASFMLASVIVVVILSALAGNVIAVNPFNLAIWTLIGAYMVITKINPSMKDSASN